MTEIPHCELEKYHYKSVRTNPIYASQGMMDVIKEELSMSMPYIKEIQPNTEEVITKRVSVYVGVDSKALELQKRIVTLETELQPLLDKKKKGKSKYD